MRCLVGIDDMAISRLRIVAMRCDQEFLRRGIHQIKELFFVDCRHSLAQIKLGQGPLLLIDDTLCDENCA